MFYFVCALSDVPFVTGLGNKRGKLNEREMPWLVVSRIYRCLSNTNKSYGIINQNNK